MNFYTLSIMISTVTALPVCLCGLSLYVLSRERRSA
jgi:hypothetical protein